MNAICLVLDRLHAGYLGAYGNTWIRTPAFDRLAVEGFVADQAFIESPHLGPLYEAYWLGRHAMGPPRDSALSLPALLAPSSVGTTLVTDDPAVAGHALAGLFGQVFELDLPDPRKPADSIDQTHLARCFAQALALADSAHEPFLLWCHLGGLGTTWDAPLEFQEEYQESGDPEPLPTVVVPDAVLAKDSDPDEVVGFSQRYAAQVTVLDTCLAAVHEWLTSSSQGRETLFVITSARGLPLGEHGRVGVTHEALYGELVQVPLVMRFPGGSGGGDRTQTLIQPSDWWPTLLEWFGVRCELASPAKSLLPLPRGEVEGLRDRVGILGAGKERAMATPAWYLRLDSRPELFLRPDDRWQVNDVADRCPEITAAMCSALVQYEQNTRHAQSSDLSPLDPCLLVGPD